jgi:hypothetical protein
MDITSSVTRVHAAATENGSERFLGWLVVMSWRAEKYHGYSRECVRLAKEASSVENRNKLLELARVWADAALVEEQAAGRVKPRAA